MGRPRKPYSLFKRPTNDREKAKRDAGKKWHGIWYYRTRDEYGERTVPRSTGETSRDRAETYVAELIAGGELIPRRNLTLSQWTEERRWWIWGECAYIRGRLERSPTDRPAIQEKYAAKALRMLKQHILPTFGSMRLSTIRPSDVDRWMMSLRETLSRKSINNIAAVLRVMLEEAVRDDLIPANPFAKVRPLTPDRVERGILTLEEARAVLQRERWRNPIHHAVSLVAAATGLRQGEILAITTDVLYDDYVHIAHNYDPKYGLGPTKTKRTRDLPIPPKVREAIDGFLEWNGFVFSTTAGRVPFSGTHCTEALYRVLDGFTAENDGFTIDRKARGITFHSWRHWFNTFLQTQGVPDREVRQMTGHATEQMQEHYSHFKASDFKSVIAAQGALFAAP